MRYNWPPRGCRLDEEAQKIFTESFPNNLLYGHATLDIDFFFSPLEQEGKKRNKASITGRILPFS